MLLRAIFAHDNLRVADQLAAPCAVIAAWLFDGEAAACAVPRARDDHRPLDPRNLLTER